jgi:hypothetical protein
MHCEYSNALELPDRPAEPDELDDPDDEGRGSVAVVELPPAGADDREVSDVDCGWVVVADAFGAVETDEAVVPVWATERGVPPPHADKTKAAANTTAIGGTDPRGRSGPLRCVVPSAFS